MRTHAPGRVRAQRWFALLLLAGLTAACNAGQSEQRGTGAGDRAAPPAAEPAARPAPAAPASSPQVAEGASPALPAPGKGRTCSADADCVVKDVGSCCGYHPQCLNKDTPTFPDQVQAQCARDGRVSACGVMAISGCQCVSGKCENLLVSDESLPAAPAPLK